MNILLIFLGFLILLFIIIFIIQSIKIRKLSTKLKNNVHFYVARDKNGTLWLYMGKPIMDGDMYCTYLDKKTFVLTHDLKCFDLKYENYDYLKWEDEPVEVFLNLED